MAFVISGVRQQKQGGHNPKRNLIAKEFGDDAIVIFEPFLRAIIPKIYNISPFWANSEFTNSHYLASNHAAYFSGTEW
jgi:hypothetical protein